jgi:hypothetical protein
LREREREREGERDLYFVDLATEIRKSSVYDSKENWYIGSIATSSMRIKYNKEALSAQGL